MRTPFLKGLEKAQERYVNIAKIRNGHAKTRYYVKEIRLRVAASESSYRQMLRDTELRDRFRYIDSMTGLCLRLSSCELALHVVFPSDGFYCYHMYYGKLIRAVKDRLQWELGNRMLLDTQGTIPILSCTDEELADFM